MSGCALPRRQHPVIDRYKAADCLPLLAEPRVKPPVREWDATVRTRTGSEIAISGYQAVSGRIVARDKRTGEAHVVATAGDYVYPADVRISSDFARVYVKADGLAGGLWHETWLFEYDLTQYRQLDRIRVDPSVLPAECPGGPTKAQGLAQ
jgi:hypothetical protein